MDSNTNLEHRGEVENSVDDDRAICGSERGLTATCHPDDISTSLCEKLVLNDNSAIDKVAVVPIENFSEDKESLCGVSSNIQTTEMLEQISSKEVSKMNSNDTSIDELYDGTGNSNSISENSSNNVYNKNYEHSEDEADDEDELADNKIEIEPKEKIVDEKVKNDNELIKDNIDVKQSNKMCSEEMKETVHDNEQCGEVKETVHGDEQCGEVKETVHGDEQCGEMKKTVHGDEQCGEVKETVHGDEQCGEVKETVNEHHIKELECGNEIKPNEELKSTIERVDLFDDGLEEGEIRELEDDEINKKPVEDIISTQHDEDKQTEEVEDHQTAFEIKPNAEMHKNQVDELEEGELEDEEISDSDIKRKRQWGTEFESDENDDSGKSVADDEEDEYTDAEEDYSSEEGEDKKERSECEEIEGESDDKQNEEEKHFSEEPEKPKVVKQAKEDEDRRDPAYVPRKGMFFEHDMRAGTDDEDKKEPEKMKKKSRADDSKWKHDKFDEFQQAPKKTHEIVRCYGYDIRRDGQRQDRKYRPKKQGSRVYSDRIPSESSPQRNQMLKPDEENKENDYVKERKERPSELEKASRRRPPREEHEFSHNHSRNDKKIFTRTEIITTHGGTEHVERFEEQRYRVEGHSQEQKHKVEGVGQEQRYKVEGRGQEQKNKVEWRGQERRPRVEEHSEKPRAYTEERRRNQTSSNYRKDNYMDRRRVNNYSKDVDSPESSQDARKKYSYSENYANEWRTDSRRSQQQGFGNRRGDVRKSYGYRRDVEEDSQSSYRGEQNRRPPRMQRITSDRSPRDMDVVNSSSQMRPRMQNPRDSENEPSDIHIEITNSKFRDEVPERMDSPPLTTAGKKSESQSSEPISRKGWAGGEFTPSWNVQQQQDKFPLQEKDEEVNTGTKSKRYSSSRQQQQQIVPKQPQYVETEYLQQMSHYQNTATPGPVYEPGHHAVIQHQGLHAAAAYAPLVTVPYPTYYSTHPGNVYPSPSPVYQHTQTTHPYTIHAQHLPNSQQIAAIPQMPEGAIYYGAQGVAHPSFYDATHSSRAKSAIPIVNPQDLTNQNRAKHPEAVVVHGQ